jgi:hypothetical protein
MPSFPKLPLIADQPLSVVLLARNEAAHIATVLTDWLGFLDRRGGEYELLVVDDASDDRTALLVAQVDHARVRLLRHETPQGEGAALRTGLSTANCPLVFYTWARPAYRPEDLGKLLERVFQPEEPFPGEEPAPAGKEIDHVHLMSGYRAGMKVPVALRILGAIWRLICRIVFSFAPTPYPGWLGWRRHLGALLARTFFGVSYQDPLCPFRLFRREILTRIPIQSNGPFAHIELLAKANFLGCMMAEEMPIDVTPGPYQGDFGKLWNEARKVFDKPDFGPAVLPTPPGEIARAP